MNVMLDLETMDTRHSGVVVSIGAVVFDKNKGLGEEFYAILDTNEQARAGRTISPDTMRWWLQQSAEARRVFAETPGDVVPTLLNFSGYVARNTDEPLMWGNGADFDCVMLGNLYDTFRLKRPWSYSNNRCYRTLKNLVHPGGNLPSRAGTHHNALDDAKYQALCAIEMLKGNLRR